MEKMATNSELYHLLLRRIDGRFLSSNQYPKKSICFAKGALADAVDLISESVIHCASNANDCDLAVAVDPDKKTLDIVWSALKSGGSCYIEWNVTQLVTLKSLRNKLEACGFDNIFFHMPKPPPDRSVTRTWIPLEFKKAIEFWNSMEYGYFPRENKKRLNLFLRRFFIKMFSGLFKIFPGLLYPRMKGYIICSTAHKPFSDKDNQIQPNKDSHIENQKADENYSTEPDNSIQDILDYCLQSQHYSSLMITEGLLLHHNIILYIFADNNSEPKYIVRMSRLAKFSQTLNNEVNTLRHIQTNFKNIKSTPKLLFSKKINGHYYMAETYIKGKTLNKILTNNNFRELSMKTTELLVDLHNSTKEQVSHDQKDKLIKPIVAKFITSYGPVLTPYLVKKTTELMNDIELTHTVCTHGDFSQWNIIEKPDGELAVIDWEYSIIDGFPVVDLIYFLSTFSFDLKSAWEGNKCISCYRDLINETSYIGDVYKECINYYCEKVDIQKSMISKYRLLSWILFLNRKYDELILNENSRPNKESLSDVLHFEIWIEEIKHLSNF
jgi:thiamine kinase-like enzyme